MVSSHTDTSAAEWLTENGVDLIRGNGRLAGTGAVEVDGVHHTAEHIVVATGAIPTCRRSLASSGSKVSGRTARSPG